jgi:hypothetical protein
MRTLSYLLGLALLIQLSGCAAARQNRQLASHTTTLRQLASDASLGPEQKLDGLAESIVLLMEETLKITDPRKGAAYLERYSVENEATIDRIMADVGEWQQSMDPVSKIAFATRLVGKPYVKKMAELTPLLRRKYKQAKFLFRLSMMLGII